MKRIATVLVVLALAGCGIFEMDITSKKLEIIAPVDGAVVPVGEVEFAWRQMEYADGYLLRVVSPSFDRAERIVKDTVIVTDSLSGDMVCGFVLDTGDYEWSVASFNTAYGSEGEILRLQVR